MMIHARRRRTQGGNRARAGPSKYRLESRAQGGCKGIRQAAKSGRAQQFAFSYASPELLFSEISPKRWGLLEAMSGAGEMSLRELARRPDRDVKSVHHDVQALLETSLLEKTESGKIVCPFDKVRVDFTLAQAA